LGAIVPDSFVVALHSAHVLLDFILSHPTLCIRDLIREKQKLGRSQGQGHAHAQVKRQIEREVASVISEVVDASPLHVTGLDQLLQDKDDEQGQGQGLRQDQEEKQVQEQGQGRVQDQEEKQVQEQAQVQGHGQSEGRIDIDGGVLMTDQEKEEVMALVQDVVNAIHALEPIMDTPRNDYVRTHVPYPLTLLLTVCLTP
jgi:hypothetical protein